MALGKDVVHTVVGLFQDVALGLKAEQFIHDGFAVGDVQVVD